MWGILGAPCGLQILQDSQAIAVSQIDRMYADTDTNNADNDRSGTSTIMILFLKQNRII